MIDLEDEVFSLRQENKRLRQRVAELERVIDKANIVALEKDAERWRKVAAAYARYKDPSCDDDTYTFTGTVGLIVEAIDAAMADPDDDFTRGEHDL